MPLATPLARAPLGLALLLPLTACGASPSPDRAGPTPSAGPEAPSASASAAPDLPSAPAATSAAAAAARAPRPAQESYPDGVSPLDEAEASELAKSCKAFADAVAKEGRKAADKAKPGTRLTDVMLETIERLRTSAAAGPKGRCAELMRRDTEAYAARKVEVGAIVMLKIALTSLGDTWSAEKKLCPSVGPVPKDAATLKTAKTRAELGPEVDALRCVAPSFADPDTRWSLEVRTDATKKTFELIARGFPVPNGPMAELFVAGEVGADGVPLDLAVMRR